MGDWSIERLRRSHDRASFDCGKPLLNHWLQQLSGQYERRNLARIYVATRPNESPVFGYYALAAHQVSYEALPSEHSKGLPTIDVPVILLGQLAVDRGVQGRGLGTHLLIDALCRAAYVSEHVGVRAVEVHAIDDDARRFYLKHGFTSLQDDPHHLFLPMQVIRQLRLPPLSTPPPVC